MPSPPEWALKKSKAVPKKKKKSPELRRRRIQLWRLLNGCPLDVVDQIAEWIDDLGDAIAYVLNKIAGEQYEAELKVCKYYVLPRVLRKGCTVEVETSENEGPNGAVEIFRYPPNGPTPGPALTP